MAEFEEFHLSPAGRRVTLRRAPDDPDVYTLSHADRTVARLAPPDPDAPERVDGRVEWRLSLPRSEYALGILGFPGGVPIEGALLELDYALGHEADQREGR